MGRCTRGYVAYHIDRDTLCFVKDSWQPDHKDVHPEHEVYARLKAHNVAEGVMTFICGGDVGGITPQMTKTHSLAAHGRRIRRKHNWLAVEEVCRPLTDFCSFRELTSLMLGALCGEWFCLLSCARHVLT